MKQFELRICIIPRKSILIYAVQHGFFQIRFQETFKNFFTEYFISFSKDIAPPGCEKESSREKYRILHLKINWFPKNCYYY